MTNEWLTNEWGGQKKFQISDSRISRLGEYRFWISECRFPIVDLDRPEYLKFGIWNLQIPFAGRFIPESEMLEAPESFASKSTGRQKVSTTR